MRIDLKLLKKVDRVLVASVAVIVLAIAGTVWTTLDLGARRDALAEHERELVQKELDAGAVVLPTEEERRAWASQQNLLASRLLPDAEVTQFFSEISRLSRVYRLQDFDIDSEEQVVGEVQRPRPGDELLDQVGIRRYLVFTITFGGGYSNIAQFVQAVGALPRLTEFVSVDFRRSVPEIRVSMVFRVYKAEDVA